MGGGPTMRRGRERGECVCLYYQPTVGDEGVADGAGHEGVAALHEEDHRERLGPRLDFGLFDGGRIIYIRQYQKKERELCRCHTRTNTQVHTGRTQSLFLSHTYV